MTDYAHIEQLLTGTLGLRRRPVAIAIRETAPPGVEPFQGSLPSGCSFWKLAADGRIFSTAQGDHYNCPIGSYTHNIPLPPEREPELMQTLTWMTGDRLHPDGRSASHPASAGDARGRGVCAARPDRRSNLTWCW